MSRNAGHICVNCGNNINTKLQHWDDGLGCWRCKSTTQSERQSRLLAMRRQEAVRRLLRVEDSDNVARLGYNYDTDQLDVVFKATPTVVYRYDGITPAMFCKLVSASSIGTFIHEHIRDRYRFHKHGVPEDEPEELFLGVPTPKTVTVSAHVAKAARGPLPSKAEVKTSDQEAYDAVTNRQRKS